MRRIWSIGLLFFGGFVLAAIATISSALSWWQSLVALLIAVVCYCTVLSLMMWAENLRLTNRRWRRSWHFVLWRVVALLTVLSFGLIALLVLGEENVFQRGFGFWPGILMVAWMGLFIFGLQWSERMTTS